MLALVVVGGGLRTNVPGVARANSTPLTANAYPVTPGSYTISIGRGGFRRYQHQDGDDGGNTNFYRNGTSMPNALYIRGTGGGGGGKENPNSAGRPGGSGGGGGRNSAGGSGDNTNDPNHTRPQGTPGYGPGGGGQFMEAVVLVKQDKHLWSTRWKRWRWCSSCYCWTCDRFHWRWCIKSWNRTVSMVRWWRRRWRYLTYTTTERN